VLLEQIVIVTSEISRAWSIFGFLEKTIKNDTGNTDHSTVRARHGQSVVVVVFYKTTMMMKMFVVLLLILLSRMSMIPVVSSLAVETRRSILTTWNPTSRRHNSKKALSVERNDERRR
jgi:hypothetical protein